MHPEALALAGPLSVGLLSVALGLSVFLRGRSTRHFTLARVLGLFTVAGMFGAGVAWASAIARSRLGVGPELPKAASTLLAFHILLEAPVIETAKAVLVWRAYRRGALSSVRIGAMHGVLVGAGFAFGEVAREVLQSSHPLPLSEARLALAVLGHVFFSMGWSALLSRGGRDRFFGFSWVALAASHGFYRDVVFERPAGQLALVLPLLPFMLTAGWLLVFRGTGRAIWSRRFESARALVSDRWEAEGPQALLEALMPSRSRASFLWIIFGSLVTLGVTLTFLAASVLIGNRLGADFTLLDDSSLTRVEPLLLLGGALLAAFPFSAFIVARASAAQSVVEPAWSTALAALWVLVFFSVTEPGAVIVAVALTPVAFLLGCFGAWAGVDSHGQE